MHVCVCIFKQQAPAFLAFPSGWREILNKNHFRAQTAWSTGKHLLLWIVCVCVCRCRCAYHRREKMAAQKKKTVRDCSSPATQRRECKFCRLEFWQKEMIRELVIQFENTALRVNYYAIFPFGASRNRSEFVGVEKLCHKSRINMHAMFPLFQKCHTSFRMRAVEPPKYIEHAELTKLYTNLYGHLIGHSVKLSFNFSHRWQSAAWAPARHVNNGQNGKRDAAKRSKSFCPKR